MKRNYSKKELIMIHFFKNAGFEMEVSGCGCCGSPNVIFKVNGQELLNDSDCNFNTEDVEKLENNID